MNNRRRQKIMNAILFLDKATFIIEECKDEEEESKCNLEGTSLECTEKYEKIESSYEYISDAINKLESVKEWLGLAMYP